MISFPYFSRLKHFKGARDTFGKSTYSLAAYITILLGQGSLTLGIGLQKTFVTLFEHWVSVHFRGENSSFDLILKHICGEEALFQGIFLNCLKTLFGLIQLSEL